MSEKSSPLPRLVRARLKNRADYPPELLCPNPHPEHVGLGPLIVDCSDLIPNMAHYCTVCRVIRLEHPQMGIKVVAGALAGRYAVLSTLDLDEGPLEGQ